MSATVARASSRTSDGAVGTGLARAAVILALVAGAGTGLLIGAHARGGTGDVELTHLLRAMALLKLLFVVAAAGAMWWRLQVAVSPPRLAGYALASAAMAIGPGLIWFLAYIGAASVLLHGGVAAAAVLLWRDEASSRLLDDLISRRRGRLRRQP